MLGSWNRETVSELARLTNPQLTDIARRHVTLEETNR
jgi:hypothetical protein